MVIKKIKEQSGIKKRLSSFQREFRRQLATFITGAFAFVAALLWRDAIRSFLDRYQNLIYNIIPIREFWIADFFIALAVSVVAVMAIMIISKVLKVENK